MALLEYLCVCVCIKPRVRMLELIINVSNFLQMINSLIPNNTNLISHFSYANYWDQFLSWSSCLSSIMHFPQSNNFFETLIRT